MLVGFNERMITRFCRSFDSNDTPLLIGGIQTEEDITDRPGQVKSYSFTGCIRSLRINDEQVRPQFYSFLGSLNWRIQWSEGIVVIDAGGRVAVKKCDIWCISLGMGVLTVWANTAIEHVVSGFDCLYRTIRFLPDFNFCFNDRYWFTSTYANK